MKVKGQNMGIFYFKYDIDRVFGDFLLDRGNEMNCFNILLYLIHFLSY